MSPDRFITVSNTEYCTYLTQIDIVTDKDKHTCAGHISSGAWLAVVKSSLIDPGIGCLNGVQHPGGCILVYFLMKRWSSEMSLCGLHPLYHKESSSKTVHCIPD